MKPFLIILLFIFENLNAQSLKPYLSAEIGGPCGFYGIGVGTNYIFKNQNQIGLRISSGYWPETSLNNGTFIPLSFQIEFIPSKLLLGKLNFRTGYTNYYASTKSINSIGMTTTYSTINNVHTTFNCGIQYCLIGKQARNKLYVGADALLYFRTHGQADKGYIPILPIPSIQYKLVLN